ncbi:sensor histidine kinase [Collimonas sp.]|jgi:two-component system sensor histidine kinase QseC|uniref:sensor histidine kinase n=1 Tax=Collimonas sp. TaxID=1963772 RepID=UPI002CAA8F56|nr:ATP-binding protein [Collimonas sp.]HWW06827.1 ATP-binding protein [Collimonas sp.]
MRPSLATRLIVSTAATLLIISAVVFAALAAVLQWGPQMLLRQELRSNAEHLVTGMRFDSAGRFAGVVLSARNQYIYDALKSDAIYCVLDRQGALLTSSDGAKTPLLPLNTRFAPDDSGIADFTLVRAGATLHVFTKRVAHERQNFYIQIARSERLQAALLSNDSANFRAAIIAAVLIAMLVFTIVVWITFNRALRPLRNVSEAASRIESNNLDARLSTADMPKELVPLMDAFNKALDRLELGYRTQQEFLATVAHELKTPLALIRGQIELDGLADRDLLLKDVDRMARQVHQLLHLAEVSDRKNFLFEEMNATAVIQDVAEHLTRLAERLGVSVHLALPKQKILLDADGAGLFVLVKNLLENALHHSPRGSEVVITVAADLISVRDRGRGITPEEMPMLFKRFWRGASRRDEGAGLGLSICKEIALAHGWQLIVNQDRQPGAEFMVAFA